MKKLATRSQPEPVRFAIGLAAIGAILVILSGCSTQPTLQSYDAVSRAMHAVRVADSDGAASGAPSEYQLAADRLASSRSAYDDNRFEDARRLAEQAHIHARIAVSRSRTMATYARISALDRNRLASNNSGGRP